jgi:peptidoglycan-associated lipoprotein
MNVRSYLVVLAALVMVVALIACDSGPSAPVGQAGQGQPAQAGQGQPAGSPPASNLPPREVAATAEPSELRNIHFDFDQVKIRSSEGGLLRDNTRWLKSHADMMVLIGGHADQRGSDEYNTKLGERRANAVRSYLIAQGVEADRITTATYGERSPVCREQTEDCWAKNRRAELQVKAR